MKRDHIFLLALAAAACMTSCSSGGESSQAPLQNNDTTAVTTTTSAAAASTVPTTAAPQKAEPVYKFDPEATETVITVSSPDTGEWKNPMGEDYIDARSMPDDVELTFTVEIALTEETVKAADSSHQIAFAPCYASNWNKIAAEPQMLYGENSMPVGANMLHTNLSNGVYTFLKDPETGELSEDIYRLSDKSVMAEVFVKADGFIKISPAVWKTWKTGEPHTVTFTFSREALAQIRQGDPAGLLFQCSGGFELRKITVNYGNILTHEQYIKWQETAAPGDTWRNS